MQGSTSQARVLGGVWDDVRYGLRALRKSPGLTAVALSTLVLGIGANAAMFSVVNAVLLRPLPFHEPDRLIAFWGSAPKMGLPVVHYPEAFLVHFRARSRTLEQIGAYNWAGFTLTGAGEPERIEGAIVTSGFFNTLGRAPLLGRVLLPEEETAGRNQVAVLGYGLWQRRFGGDPAIVGKSVVLDDKPWSVVGVMPADFEFPNRTQVWVPLVLDAQDLSCWCFTTIGRLAAGRTPEAAAREISVLSDDFWRLRKGEPARGPDSAQEPKSITVAMPLARMLVGDVRTALLVLLGAVATVLLIACANVANLLLARATSRGREMAVRGCLGASPWRIVRQLLVESLMLGLAGVVIGLVATTWVVRAVAAIVVERTTHVQEVALDARVLLFTAAVGLVTVVLCGLAPALRGARVDLRQAVGDGGRGTRTRGSAAVMEAFVVAQLALSLVLLIGAGLLVRSLQNLLAVELGFRPQNVLVGRVSLPSPAYRDESRARTFSRSLLEGIRTQPGVQAAGLSETAPFSAGNNQNTFVVKGREPGPGQPTLVASVRAVTPGYFAAVGTPLRSGRLIEETDRESAPPVAVVDEMLARRYWGQGQAVGHELRIGEGPWRVIVGVVAAIKHGDVSAASDRYVYVPISQTNVSQMDVVVRSAAEPQALAATVRQAVHDLDPTLPVHDVHTLETAVERSLSTRRLTNRVLVGFALTALGLAAIGIYGVTALDVSQRTNEFGIRLALGATSHDVLALVLRQGLRLVLAGVVLGLASAGVLVRVVESLLFDVPPIDAATFAGVALALAAIALASCALPARRATGVDPLAALRSP